jgi:hypothetical protein
MVEQVEYRKLEGYSQDKHNDQRAYFQNGEVYLKDSNMPGDYDAAEKCMKLCGGM